MKKDDNMKSSNNKNDIKKNDLIQLIKNARDEAYADYLECLEEKGYGVDTTYYCGRFEACDSLLEQLGEKI